MANKYFYILSGIILSISGFSRSTMDSLLIEKKVQSGAKKAILPNGNVLYDFEKDFFGKLRVDISMLSSGDTAVLYIGEKLDESGKIDRKPGGNIRSYRYVVTKNTEDILFLPNVPDKKNTSGNAIRLPLSMGIVAPFRYAEIEKGPYAGKIKLSREYFHYRFNDQASSFNSSDKALNAIWDLCKHTIKATSFMGLYIDGDRERIPYEADALINQLSHYALDTEYSIARNTFEYLMLHPTWPTEWHLQMHQIAWFDYLYSGNTALINQYYDLLKLKTLEAFEQPNGLISTTAKPQRKSFLDAIHYVTFDNKQSLRDITDWPQRGNKVAGPEYIGESDLFVFCDYNSVVNAYYYQALKLMKKFAEITGRPEDVKYYDQKVKLLFQNYNHQFVNPSTGLIKDGDTTLHSSFHANFFALCFGLIAEEHKDKVKAFLKSKDMACSVYGSQFFMDALYNEGMGDYALKMLTKKDERGWYHMIEVGAGMTMEAWDLKFKPNLDWNHAWGAAPSNLIAFRLMGIQPSAPGFAEATIKPEIGTLTTAAIRVPTALGTIYEKITQDEKNYKVVLELPIGMKAKVELPAFQKEIQKLNITGTSVSPTLKNGKWVFENIQGKIQVTLKK
jgi:hypothetical protein